MEKLKIYAGLDRDGIVKLFTVDPASHLLIPITHAVWLEILGQEWPNLDLDPGEMPIVILQRES